MAANYLHGVETIEVERGPRPVSTVKSAVIGLIGTAPICPTVKDVNGNDVSSVNTAVLSLSEKDAAGFGPQLPGFSIPQALSAIYDHGAGTVVVINVLDPTVHKSPAAPESVTLNAADVARTKNPAVANVVVKNADGTQTYVLGKDYALEPLTGKITRLKAGNIAAGANLTLSYDYADPGKVTAADIIGGVNAAGKRYGGKALQDTFNQFGFFAKLLIAPGFCTQSSVAAELAAMADKLDAIAYIDAPIGTSLTDVLAGRGPLAPAGTIHFNTSSDRVRLCYPYVMVADGNGGLRLDPLSARAAGLRAKVDNSKGFWWSSSNQELAGVVGVERQLTAMIDDPNSEVNQLNAVGISTVFNSVGTGFRLWGNRTAAWPAVTSMRNFENVRRTGDVINESIRYFSQQYIDMPLNQATIDSLVESVNGYGRKLIGDGALLGFKAWFDVSRNPQTELSAGHLLISYKYTVAPPLERLSFETEITSEYLLSLKGGN
ncbi:phage tail sheath subtilisin-like domain-containing protein [Chromobacterium sp. IIBBL 290-4]|uniref:phage tail sheath subtilisin-like domain-containing protein n=1 Tax=Chromobacterium sp. IIBBL 290-4 TaxID=2953890 RepID=UPI0020B74B18|nr:phage tail sheath subtilisin-like domain-containing protein [Chromobacterium sp. IIBBL 290-4]UTH76085.1 phage tail sheath subtilisin-like domain-containing protein [Chromobacterium sp. IIBBL 290-4]